MATVTKLKIGPADHGRELTLDEFIDADFEPGWLYDLARGRVDVTEVPGLNHGRIVRRLTKLIIAYEIARPDVINYSAGGGECRLRLPGMVSDRHPDQAVYLNPPPPGKRSPWTSWIPHLVAEVLSEGGEHRDLVEKREEYLRIGVYEYWIIDPKARTFTALKRAGDVWEESKVAPGAVYATHFLPGVEVRPDDLFGPVEEPLDEE